MRSYNGTSSVSAITVATTGYVGIQTPSPTSSLTVNGVVQSLSGGVKYPDGTTQTTATIATTTALTAVSVTCNGAWQASAVATCTTGYTVSGCSAWTSAFAYPAGAEVSGNGCQAGCGGSAATSLAVQAVCVKLP